MMRCENCGWLSVNPGGAMFCDYSGERTWKDECCMAWKDKSEDYNEPKTNADRIRAMTDEELATFLGGEDNDPWMRCQNCKWESCEECCLDWLKEEI